jgi:hypothetical protein
MRSYVDWIKLYASDGWTAVPSDEGTAVARTSPVSRGRNKKRSSKRVVKATGGVQRTNMQHAAPATREVPLARVLPPRERPAWFGPSINRILENASALPAARGPRELEQLTAELVGGELHRTIQEGNSGLWFDWWLAELVDAGRRADQEGSRVEAGVLAPARPGCAGHSGTPCPDAAEPGQGVGPWQGHRSTSGMADPGAAYPSDRRRAPHPRRVRHAVRRDHRPRLPRNRRPRGAPVRHRRVRFVQLVGGGVFDDVEQTASA